jgi:hypothetical protein
LFRYILFQVYISGMFLTFLASFINKKLDSV